MTSLVRRRPLAATLVQVAIGPLLPGAMAAEGSAIRVWRTGRPNWQPVDFHLFAAPIGTAASGYAEFLETMQALLPPPNHMLHPQLGVGPGAPHAPPYDGEFGAGLARLGYHEGTRFSASEFSAGMGVWLCYMVVPAPGTTGSSPDFDAGPIITNAQFPVANRGQTRHRGLSYSAPAEFAVPPLDATLDPPFFVDGHSHFPSFWADNADFGDPSVALQGVFRFRLSATDAAGNGWNIDAPFVLTP